MCIKKDDFSVKKRVFAHVFLLPKSFCKYGVRVRSLVAVSDGGKEFRCEADHTRYRGSVSEGKAAFISFCRECGVKRGRGEVWFSESVVRVADGAAPLCDDCPKRGCSHIASGPLGCTI